jgi:hypothetical protein
MGMITKKGTPGFAVCCTMLATLALASSSAAQIYKWVDEKGGVHFTNDPPPKVAVEVIPEGERRPRVVDQPPSSLESAAELPGDVTPRESQRGAASGASMEDVESEEIIVDDAETIIVDDGGRDVVTGYRANSPRNRPGQPIRQPNRQPVRQPRRAR